MGDLILHRGAWEATAADLASVPVPDATETWSPVPYSRFVEEVKLHLPRFGLTTTREQYALARDGLQMFGVLSCSNGHGTGKYQLAIALRNSYDRSLAAELAAGSRLWRAAHNLDYAQQQIM